MFTTIKHKEIQNPTSLLSRVILYKGEVYRLSPTYQGLRVIAGHAWVTLAGNDIMLTSGEEKSLSTHQETALISTLQNTPLIFEVWGEAGSSVYNNTHLIPTDPCFSGVA